MTGYIVPVVFNRLESGLELISHNLSEAVGEQDSQSALQHGEGVEAGCQLVIDLGVLRGFLRRHSSAALRCSFTSDGLRPQVARLNPQ